jgi:galactose mutarotase-like enzyme
MSTLREGELVASFLPDAGMICHSLRLGDRELLGQRAGVEEYRRSGSTMGVPLLYPWANRLSAFPDAAPREFVKTDANGLPIHGVIGSRLHWDLIGAGSARLAWTQAQDWFAVFPHEHELLYEATLSGGALTIALTVTAADPTPVSFGFHPYLVGGGEVSLPAMRRLDADARQIPTGGGEPVAAQRFQFGTRTYDDGFDGVGDGTTFSCGALEVEFLEGYRYAQVFSPPGEPFICFEPMTAPTNALISGTGLRIVEPGESLRAAFAIRVTADI